MVTRPRRWQIAPTLPEAYRASLATVHPLAAQILYNHGLSDPTTAAGFLKEYDGLDDPLALHGMPAALDRLRHAIRAGEPIAVYGDFDADGVTATALLVLTLQALGGQAQPYIPHRVNEGYGLNVPALEELARTGVRLVVTADCGMRSPNEIACARRCGMDVIVTDHHSPGPEPLDAFAIVNPHQPECSYPYKGLAGVGLTFKLAQALLRADPGAANGLSEESLLDLVALGTVADLAPLTGENRALVVRGLARLNTNPRPGVKALLRQAGLRSGNIDAMSIGYALGPRLNAAGRIAHANVAYQLLVAENPADAEQLAQRLDELNRERQRITAEAQEWAREIAAPQKSNQLLLFIADPRLPAGVVGLVASRLVEEFYRPAVVVETGEEESRGSARSIPEFHITRALDACADLLVRHGGHATAGGFTVSTSRLPELRDRLHSLAAQELGGYDLTPTLAIDAEVPLREMGWPLWNALQQLHPFGESNPEPVFVCRNVQVRQCRAVGTDGAHLKLLLSEGRATWDGIAFWQGDLVDHLPDRVDVACSLQTNEWNGEKRLQLNVQDIRPAGWEEFVG